MTPPKDQPSFRLRAKTALLEKGLTVTAVARKANCSRTAASQAINHGLHAPTRRRIAEILGIAA